VARDNSIFEITNGGKIKLTGSVMETLQQYKQVHNNSLESGGVILGRFIKVSKNIVVDKITTPMRGDKQTRFSFKRLSPLHQGIITEEWKKSNGTSNYLGEWHTHSEDFPTPSGVDIRDWKRKLKKDVFSGRYLYFIIAGIKSIEIWEGDRRTLEIVKLKITN
jgi:integrative and conjugative element protein (TIGR02256 family)